ncbi:MAG: tetratricopeptide repeat protein [Prolixibacteraceae bacterium]|nr:tetratricopeptide repeat protein [Prolixibacteraceae bacterium]
MRRFILNTFGVIFLLTILQGCSTEKNTLSSRIYHKVTSKYNVHFNASESLKSGSERIEQNIQDDYTRLLPVYKESDPSAANMVNSEMENVILKASKLIEVHSITEKPRRRQRRTRKYQEFASKEEFNPWIDDGYLLIGKAHFFQHNFVAASDNFSFVLRRYPDDDARHEAQIWLLRSYSELGRFAEASEVIQAISNDNDFPRSLEKDLSVATADYYIKQNNYSEAIKFIDIAQKKIFRKKNRARLQFIKAQLYELDGNSGQATEAYKDVIKMNPGYRMAFNAKIKSFILNQSVGDTGKMKKELEKMLRDDKNREFRDQIYYTLGNLYFNEGNRDVAMENYRNSVAASFQNPYQRALSAITLADLYFEDFNYRQAQSYYDSAMIIIDDTYPGYPELSTKYRSLSNLVSNILTVEREDSLQRVANMPEAQREALIAGLMRAEQERLRDMESLAMQGQRDQGYYRSNRYRMGMGSSQQGGGWYFYNPQTVSYGQVTFQQRWGQRQLEDDWRRSNKSVLSMGEEDQESLAEDMESLVMREEDPLKKEFYTQDLPLNDSLMNISHERIQDALYNTGKIFKSEFSDYKRSAEAYEELIRRYSSNDYLLSVYFDLYDLYEILGDIEKSNYYKNLIISKFSESRYASFLLNPDFFIEMDARTDSLNRIYETAFSNYRSGNYNNVIKLTSSMKKLDPDTNLLAKIDFMEAISNGTQTDIMNFENLLESYLEKYPDAEPSPLAGEILALIQDSTLADYQKLVDMGYINEEIQNDEVLMRDLMENDEFGGKFSYEEDLLHYFVIVYPRDEKVDMNRLKFDIANYNIDHYTKLDFDIETENLNERFALVAVRALENKENGVIYHRAIIRNAPVFETLKSMDYYNFTISSTNYRQILSEKSITDYLRFFVKNYSRYIQSDFSDEEFDLSPEELMAKAKEEESILRERGEFVVVQTGASPLFSSDIDTTQLFVLAVQDPKFSMRQTMRLFTDFNRNEFREWNLKTQIKGTGDYQMLIVEGIPSLNESMSYFKQVVVTRSLFEALGQAAYRNFLITEENLNKVIEEEKTDDYINFFRSYYIQRNQSGPSVAPSSDAAPLQTETTSEDHSGSATLSADREAYSGPYVTNIDKPHYMVFVIPREGIDKDEFLEKVGQFNMANETISRLVIEEQSLDEFRDVIIISGLPEKEAASRYFKMVVQNRDLFTPLGSATYRNFLITAENFDIFMREKNITEYMDFYKQNYQEQ